MDEDLLADLDDLGEESYGEDELSEAEIKHEIVVNPDSLQANTKTFHSKQLQQTLAKIDEFLGKDRSKFYNSGPVEQDPEYQTIVQANLLNVEIIHEIGNVGKMIKDLYKPRFSELESLILNPIDYAKAVLMIGNERDLTKLDLKSFLASATVMVITVTSTTSDGRDLTDEELDKVKEACKTLIEMENTKIKLLAYVQSRMNLIAPNLTALLGSACAAKIMGLAGGLTALSKIPGCNILVMGAEKKGSLGLSSVVMKNHAGYIYECELVVSSPKHIKRKAARILSAKAALACRCDLSREYPDGKMGRNFREDSEKKIALLVEPPPSKKIKALPLPIEHKKRRGGKRARKAKERMAPSDLQKASNRMAFGEEEKEVTDYMGNSIGLGLVGGATGKLKLAHKDFKVPVSKKHKTMAIHQGSSNPNSGLASSVAFTPIKGIELENPDAAAQKIKSINDKYFSAQTFKRKQG